MAVRLKETYDKTVVPEMMKRFGIRNALGVPRLKKIVVNTGVGRAIQDSKLLEEAAKALGAITGQKAVTCAARRSIAGFRLREGMAIGCKVTLRGQRMYEFLDRIVSIVLPRIRDFRGLPPNALDGFGNYSLGIEEHAVFPEVNMDDFENIFGVGITLCISGRNNEQSLEMLRLLGLPFRPS